MKKKILIINGWFLPGFKGGGPVQSCNNIIQNLYNKYDFYVLCGDRDFKDANPYDNVKINEWNDRYNAKIYYLSQDKQTLKGIKEIINSIDFDIIYLNNYFNFRFTIIPMILRRFKKIKNTCFILSLRGDFINKCKKKRLKKYTFILVAKILGLYNDIIWHATVNSEKEDILKLYPKARIVVIPNLKQKYVEKDITQTKKKGELKMMFVSRISSEKNIEYALNVLKNINKGNVTYDIYGPLEDKKYWSECLRIIKTLPSNVNVNYCGELPHEKIAETFQKYHAFFFTTKGENFGHVIAEATTNNCPCLLSKGTTPWDDYIEEIGYGASLSNSNKFVGDIYKLIDLDQKKFIELVKKNNEYIKKKFDDREVVKKYIELFK